MNAQPTANGAWDGRIHVEVQHDPMRIAPGQTGTLLLLVNWPKGQAVANPNGRVVMTQQPETSYGAARWSAPGKSKHYDDRFLVQMPVTIAGNTKHGSLAITGNLHLTGSFGAGSQGQVTDGDGGLPPNASADPATGSAQRTGSVNRVTVPFSGKIRVGPPMPKPGVRKRAGTKPTGVGDAGTQASRNDASKTQQQGTRPRQLGDAKSTTTEGPLDVDGDPADAGGDEAEAADWWMYLAGGGGLIALLFLLFRRRPA
ncbi:MAG: hypothetical protein CMJ85_10220 [Planctomycetes bacterium]|nr:hypothetical protein [Planctomycetota bacterium]